MTRQRVFDILYMQSQCILKYSRLKRISVKETVEIFKKYNILEYITVCYEILHLSGLDYVVKDISKRIEKGDVYDRRYLKANKETVSW